MMVVFRFFAILCNILLCICHVLSLLKCLGEFVFHHKIFSVFLWFHLTSLLVI